MSKICEQLRAGHQYSGIVDPLDIEAADLIEKYEKAIDDALQRLNESNTGISGLVDTIHATHAILRGVR